MSTDREALPLVPDLSTLGFPVWPDPTPGIRAAHLALRDEGRTLALHAERVRSQEVRVPLTDVAGLVRVRWGGVEGRTYAMSRLLVVGHDGRTLAKGVILPWPLLSAIWTLEVLAGLGVPVLPDEQHRSSRAAQRAHAGAVPNWWVTTAPLNILIFAGGIVLLFLVFLLLFGS